MFQNMSVEQKASLIEHLEALRKASLISIIAIFIAALICFNFNEQILRIIISPIHSLNEKLVVTSVTEAFVIKLKLSLLAGFVAAFPVVVIATWRFFKPALYPSERKYFYFLFPISILLFVGGLLFSYFVVLRAVLVFLIYIAGPNLDTMFKVDQYVSFVMAFTIPFGITFELPVLVYLLTKLGLITHKLLAKNRRYALLIITILGAALTPGGDPISMIMMAVPVYILYEISILVARLAKPGKERRKGKRK